MRAFLAVAVLAAQCFAARLDGWARLENKVFQGGELTSNDVELILDRLEDMPEERGGTLGFMVNGMKNAARRDPFVAALLADPVHSRLTEKETFEWLLDLTEADHDRCVRANTLQVGSRRPLGVGAGSAAILAALPENRCDRLISSNSEVYGRYGDLSTAEVRSMVRHWRKHRYLVNNSIIIPDVSAIAVAVFESGRLIRRGNRNPRSIAIIRWRLAHV